jgi:hypothetical protein
VNNAVARIGGLVAIAVLGVILSRSFESRVTPRLESLSLSATARADVQRELPKMAGMKLDSLPSVTPTERGQVQAVVDNSFAGAYKTVMLLVGALAALAALIGLMIA